jgi:hypothetical protein
MPTAKDRCGMSMMGRVIEGRIEKGQRSSKEDGLGGPRGRCTSNRVGLRVEAATARHEEDMTRISEVRYRMSPYATVQFAWVIAAVR